jgi:zeaxanthin glucosyltransferase
MINSPPISNLAVERLLRIGVLCPEVSGHLNPMFAVCRALQARGHRLTMVGSLDGEARVRAAGLDYRSLGAPELPLGTWAIHLQKLSELSGWNATRYTMESLGEYTRILLRDVPLVLEELKLDGLLVDQFILAGRTIAERIGIPMVNFCGAMMLNVDAYVPQFFFGWQYRRDAIGWVRNRFGYWVMERMVQSVMGEIDRYRRLWKLTPHRDIYDAFSPLAQLVPIPREFDFPRESLPNHLHYVGPLPSAAGRSPADFDFSRLDGRPLVFASFGTLQNEIRPLFEKLAAAAAQLPVQLVISMGGGGLHLDRLDGDPLVVPFAPQLELLRRARLTVTHGGLNTVMESLCWGVPLVAVPIANDQPGIAARVQWHGLGEKVRLSNITSEKLRTAMHKVLVDALYRENASRMRSAIERMGGLPLAVKLIEQAITTRLPVPSGWVQQTRRSKGDD